jgi:hypothetical protein
MTPEPGEGVATPPTLPPPPTPPWVDQLGPARILAEIWATVDLERWLIDLGLPVACAIEAVDDPILGARVLLLDEPPGGTGPIVLAEPTTEGRLAAFLARHGEGRAGRYLSVPAGPSAIRAGAAAAGASVSRPADGPFGPSVLVLGGPLGSPHLFLVPVLVPRAAVPSSA